MWILSIKDLLCDMFYLLSQMMADKNITKLMRKWQNKDIEIKPHNLKTGRAFFVVFSVYTVAPACRFSSFLQMTVQLSLYSRKTDHIPFLLCSSKRHGCCSKSSAACCSMQNCFYLLSKCINCWSSWDEREWDFFIFYKDLKTDWTVWVPDIKHIFN